MSEIAVQARIVETSLTELAEKAAKLGEALQMAAPGELNSPNPSVKYLFAVAKMMHAGAEKSHAIRNPDEAPAQAVSPIKPGK